MTVAPRLAGHGRPKEWLCDGCDTWSVWTDQHMSYGSLKAEDEGRWNKLKVTCSDGCRMRLIADGKLPAVGEDGTTPDNPNRKATA